MLSENAKLANNTKAVIDEQKESFLLFRGVDDAFVKELADYLVKTHSIVDSIAFIDSSITRDGIEYLLEKYGNKLVAINMPDNGLLDEDIQGLEWPRNIKSLGVRDNYLGRSTLDYLQTLGLDQLDFGDQKIFSDQDDEDEPVRTMVFSDNLDPHRNPKDDTHKKSDLKVDDFLSFLSTLDEQERIHAVQYLSQKLKGFCLNDELLKKQGFSIKI